MEGKGGADKERRLVGEGQGDGVGSVGRFRTGKGSVGRVRAWRMVGDVGSGEGGEATQGQWARARRDQLFGSFDFSCNVGLGVWVVCCGGGEWERVGDTDEAGQTNYRVVWVEGIGLRYRRRGG